MGRAVRSIEPALERWIARQHVFFVATAPSGDGGHVNLSPKGLDTLRVLSPKQVAYLDLTGSGVETIAHLRDNGRITIMLCAFEGPPRIVRIYGTGRVVVRDTDEYAALAPHFPDVPGARGVIVVDVERVADSCGYGVPVLRYVEDRQRLVEWAEHKGDDGLVRYRAEHNATSIDGLAGLPGLAPLEPDAR